MKTLEDQLAQYAEYHRSRRNIATHFVGIPLIVMALVAFLSRFGGEVAGWPWSLATLAFAPAVAYYVVLDRALGLVMAVLLALCLWLGVWAAGLGTLPWLGVSLGGFVVGWIFQFVGHYWEGRKPAFVDDLIGLAIGPLFVVAEALFKAGWRPELLARIEVRAGQTLP